MSTKTFVTGYHAPGVSSFRRRTSMLLHDLFDRQARDWPDRPALEIPPAPNRRHRIVATDRERASAAAGIHARLAAIARPDAIVATLLPRTTVHAFSTPLGILRAGGAFTCI